MKGRLVDIQRATTNNGVPLKETLQKKIDGWEGKPKGLLQVLWERGWINNDDSWAYKNYTITGKKNEFNLIQPETH
jgi:hypothetical protein